MVPYLVPRVMSKMIHKRPAPLNSKKWTLMISKNLKLTNWLLYQNPNLEPIASWVPTGQTLITISINNIIKIS